MEIPGLSPLSNQPTLTNPLNQDEQLVGQQTQAQATSESQNTTTVSEQATTGLSDNTVVTAIPQTEATASSIGANVDITI